LCSFYFYNKNKKKQAAAARPAFGAAPSPGFGPVPPPAFGSAPPPAFGAAPPPAFGAPPPPSGGLPASAFAPLPPELGGPTPVQTPPVQTTPPVSGSSVMLLCISGSMAGSSYPVSGTLYIGRDPGRCQIVFPAETSGVSAVHCEVRQQSPGVLLIDSGSTYGTFLGNGRKLNANEGVLLNSGDSFFLADNRYSFRIL